MDVVNDMVVSFDYTLKNEKGELLDASKENEPLTYIHGKGFMISGLEKNMEGKEQGDSFSITVKPEEAYGNYNENHTLF